MPIEIAMIIYALCIAIAGIGVLLNMSRLRSQVDEMKQLVEYMLIENDNNIQTRQLEKSLHVQHSVRLKKIEDETELIREKLYSE